ncbi:MAG: penicillin-binding protein, partial [Calditrichaeota bacterium]|nr:penicillin-binding protein [Calditrichota bacterium]
DVVLTLDLRIQSLVEEELAPAVIVEKALSAVAIVLDPKTGEVLALASLPAFDPGQPDTQPQEYQKNRAVVDIFEPGSTFKIVAAAALLESGRATLRSTIDCSAGSVTIHGKTIRDAKRHGVLTLQEVLAYSSNVGTILLSRALEKRELYDMVRRFGFLAKSGIEVEGEASGMLPAPSDWSGLTQPTLVIGQGVAATALQMAMAYGAIANRGTLLRPTLIRGHFNRDGEFVSREPVRIRQVVSPSTAKAITLALVQVVEKGTGRKAKVEGVTIAAKTGTAQISSPEGGYHDDRYYASMCGFLPAEDPQYLIFIGMDSPRGASGLHQGGDVAAPIFKRIATRIAGLDPAMLASSPAKERGSGRKVPTTGKALASPSKRGRSLPQLVKMPDLRMKPAGEAEASLKSIGLNVTLRGEGTVVVDQVPEVGEEIPAGTRVNLTIGPPKRSARGAVVVPHLVGLSIRDAIRKASESGLTVQVNGRGKVVEQHPSSGSRVNWGDVCRLEARS